MPLRPAEETRVWLFYKPRGTIATSKDPQGRTTVFEELPSKMPRVVSVGRLDYNTEGLLLLTNDGELARHLELPQNAWARQYRVRVNGHITREKLASVAKGVTISGIRYGPVKIEKENIKEDGKSLWLSVIIHEGKNREVRNIMSYLGLHVDRLIRVGYGPFRLDDLSPGNVQEIPQRVVRRSLERYFSEKRGRGTVQRSSDLDSDQERSRSKGLTVGGRKVTLVDLSRSLP